MSQLFIVFTETNEEGDDVEHRLPAKYEVCYRCQGHGKHTNPNIDGHGISAEEWHGPEWDDESREAYMSGFYDVTCHTCHGEKVTKVLDEDNCSEDLLKRYQASERQKAEWDREDRMTRMWESGGYDY